MKFKTNLQRHHIKSRLFYHRAIKSIPGHSLYTLYSMQEVCLIEYLWTLLYRRYTYVQHKCMYILFEPYNVRRTSEQLLIQNLMLKLKQLLLHTNMWLSKCVNSISTKLYNMTERYGGASFYQDSDRNNDQGIEQLISSSILPL